MFSHKIESNFVNFLPGSIISEIEFIIMVAGTIRTISRTGICIVGVFVIKVYKKMYRVTHSQYVPSGRLHDNGREQMPYLEVEA